MPESDEHAAIVHLLRSDPSLAPRLAADLLGAPLPADLRARVVDPALQTGTPVPDLVRELHRPDGGRHSVLVVADLAMRRRRAADILRILERRGIELDEDQRIRIVRSRDHATLDRAIDVRSAAELFE